MTDEQEPLYQRVGSEPMSDADLERAIESWKATHADADELQAWGVRELLRRRNDEARRRVAEQAEADSAGTTVSALREAKAERREAESQAQAARDREAARRAVGQPELGVIRRPPGRPGWTAATFHATYREARDRAGGVLAPDKAIASEFGFGLQWFSRLVRRYGRPE